MFQTVVNPIRPILASILLAALAMGGIVLPVAHDVAHGAERAEVEVAHSDHHHHQVEDDHGVEAQPYCPDAADVELVCAFCSAPPMATLAITAFGLSAPVAQEAPGARFGWLGSETPATPARGPPTA